MTQHERRGWLVVASLWATLFLLFGSGYPITGVFVMPLTRQFGWSRTRIGMLQTLLGLAMGVSAPIVGWLLVYIRPRYAIATGAALASVAFILASQAHSFPPMVVAYLLLGVGVGAGTLVPCSLVAARWFERRRGLALGFTMSGTAFGASILILIVTRAIARGGLRAAYLTLAAPLFFIVIPLALAIVRVPTASEKASVGVREAGDLPGLEVAEALRGRSFWLISLSAFAYGFSVLGALLHIMPQFLENGFTTSSAALAYSILGMAASVCKPLEGWLADSLTARVMLAVDHLGTAVALMILLGCRNMYLAVVFIALWGFSSGAPFALIPMLITESLGLKRFGPFAGIAGGFQTAGATLAPVIAGYMYDLSGSYTSAFSLFCVIALAGAAATLGCVPLERQQQASLRLAATAPSS